MAASTISGGRLRGFVMLAAGIHLISACWHIFHGGLNADEGFYAVAARSVWQGDLPYRDFGYTQMPLLPYINGLMFQFAGCGLFAQRAINGLWGAMTLLLAAIWLARRTSPAWAIGFAVFLSLSAPWMYFIHLGKTYAAAGLAAATAFWVYAEWSPGVRKVGLLALAGTIGVGCRLPIAPFFVVLWLAALLELPGSSPRSKVIALSVSLLWPAILLGPFYLAAPEAMLFWVIDFHRVSRPTKYWHLAWQDIFALAPALWLGLGLGLAHTAFARRFPDRREAILTAAVILTFAMNLLPQGVFEEYGVPLLPLLALVAALGLWRMGSTWQWLRHGLVPPGLLLLNSTVGVALLWPAMPTSRHGTWSVFLPLNAPAYDGTLPVDLARARATVRRYLPPEQPFVGPELILAAETGRDVPRQFRMGAFTVTADYPATQARRLNLATFQELDALFNDPKTPLLAFDKKADLNYAWSMPSFRNRPEQSGERWREIFRRDFVIGYEDSNFLLLVRKGVLPAQR